MVRPYLGTQLKMQLYTALRAAGITRAELARRLGWQRGSVDRLFLLDHASKLDQIDAAFAALGLNIEIQVRSGPAARSGGAAALPVTAPTGALS